MQGSIRGLDQGRACIGTTVQFSTAIFFVQGLDNGAGHKEVLGREEGSIFRILGSFERRVVAIRILNHQ